MINILIPISNDSKFFNEAEYLYPKTICEINGKMMIQLVIESFSGIAEPKKFSFVIRKKDVDKYHFDKILGLLTQDQCWLTVVDGAPQGAACSCLLAIEQINNDTPLIISNCDQLIEGDLQAIIQRFQERDLDAGVITFESVHPKWSYVRLDEDGLVCEAAEKHPISKDAIAGFYYFRKGSDFIEAAFDSIRNDASVDGLFFISPVFNQLILKGKRVGAERIDPSRYHSFYSPQKIKEFETRFPKEGGVPCRPRI